MNINYPEDVEKLKSLKVGDVVTFSGEVFTARDAAHARINKLFLENKELPVNLNNAFIYYAGPTPTPPGKIVGSIGPTTSSRMDAYASLMASLGVKGTIGKGPRDKQCIDIYRKNHIMYFVVTGGCGALIAQSVKEYVELAFFDLGPESIKNLKVENFKMIVALDYNGNYLFE